MSTGLNNVVNFMIPAVGTPRGYVVSQVFVAGTPVDIDFRNVSGGWIDAQPFRPSGVLVDNSLGTAAVVVVINQMAYRITVPAGTSLQMPYPAPSELTVTITGEGQATLVFVDYPVIPFAS